MKTDKTVLILSATILAATYLGACTQEKSPNKDRSQQNQSVIKSGELLFKQYCSSCHPDGENVSDPKNNLKKSTLKAKRIDKPEQIIAIMRKPLSRMLSFDVSTLSDKDAQAIAEYILETF